MTAKTGNVIVAQTSDTQGDSSPPPRLRLGTIRDCRRELVAVYRSFAAGRIDRATAGTRCFLLMSLVKITADHEIEERIRTIESRLDDARVTH